MAVQRAPAFRGRTSERESVDRLLANARDGQSGVLVIRGEAGVGKTALLQHAVDAAAGFRVVQIAGVESEMELPFAGLHQLCTPLLSHLAALPEPQRNALSVAFGLALGDAPDHFLVALGALTLLAETADEQQQLLCAVDDAQWLDGASAQVLGFVARRLVAEEFFTSMAPQDSPTAPGESCWRRARRYESAAPRRATTSRPGSCKSHASPGTAVPTPRSARRCS
jgi:AAA ATPase domain